jgi:hypothetical protein
MNAAIELLTKELEIIDAAIANNLALRRQIQRQMDETASEFAANVIRADALRAALNLLKAAVTVPLPTP